MQNNKIHSEFFPIGLNFLAKEKAQHGNYFYKSIVNNIIQSQSKKLVNGENKKKLSFCLVDNASKWDDIRKLRLHTYKKKVPYMLDTLRADGSDDYDARSLVFGAWYNGQALATIRFTVWPFELSEFISTEHLDNQIAPKDCNRYLEMSRLLVSPDTHFRGLMPSLIAYSGINICLYTNYKGYVGFVKNQVFQKLNKFMCSNTHYEFTIPARGEHQYQLIKGTFSADFEHLVNSLFPKYLKVGKRLGTLIFDKDN